MIDEVYEKGRARGIRILVGRGFPRALAEDAAQAAAVALIEKPPAKGVTVALYVFRIINRGIAMYESAYGSDRPHGKSKLVTYIGSTSDVARAVDRPDYTKKPHGDS